MADGKEITFVVAGEALPAGARQATVGTVRPRCSLQPLLTGGAFVPVGTATAPRRDQETQ